jgi:hypothetical protein
MKTLTLILASSLLFDSGGNTLGLASPLAIQAPAETDNAELAAMVKADQEERAWSLQRRTPSKDDIKKMEVGDAQRLARARQLLKENKVVTSIDFSHAALLFQHGNTSDDILVAHELSFLSLLKSLQEGKPALNNLPVVAEDRFLDRMGRKQRFGSQGSVLPQPAKGKTLNFALVAMDEGDDLSVTDTLRADLFMPPLAASKKDGPLAFRDYVQSLGAHSKQRYDKVWQAEQAKRPVSRALKQLAEAPLKDRAEAKSAVAAALRYYRADDLRTPDDYYYAGSLLFAATALLPSSTKVERETTMRRLLLAHELSMVAALRGQPQAPLLFAQTWDRFLTEIGQPQRYGTYKLGEAEKGKSAGLAASSSDTVRKMLGVPDVN